ncbi:MAG TPA: helix-turn-helix transcriptional regulator [Candidatus Gemmiger faecigallinarum]|nr:helix-turn-helix transcriptional regulator [Candidatus Gemmiger faecigallinarum]
MDKEVFGLRLRKYRKDKGLTIEKLAEQIGLSPNYLGDVERGKKLPSMGTFIHLVNVLDISADELLKDEVNRADYLVDSEISSRLSGLTPRRRTAVLNILDRILEELPQLASE